VYVFAAEGLPIFQVADATDNLDLRSSMIVDANELLARLAFAITVEQDTQLHSRIRSFARVRASDPLMVSLPESDAWLKIDTGRAATVQRAPIPGLVQVNLDEVANRDGALLTDLMTATHRTKATSQALQLLTPLFDGDQVPNREQVGILFRWAPAIERVAYRYCTLAVVLLDRLRPALVVGLNEPDGPPKQRLIEYWNLAHTMGHLSLLASPRDAHPWLAGLANSFEWLNWTPTFPLLRERTLWLSAVAARCAVAFGEGTIDKYLQTFSRAEHPLKKFDALFGLLAIALDQESVATHVVAEIQRIRRGPSRRRAPFDSLVETMTATALNVLRDPATARLQFDQIGSLRMDRQSRATDGLLTPAALRQDPTEVLVSGQMLGLLALPTFVGAPAQNYYPVNSTPTFGVPPSPDEIASVIGRAWVPSGFTPPTMH
jgi:hypothetical protein